MKLFNRFTKDRYKYKNNISSFKFIDFMITDLDNSINYKVSEEAKNLFEIVRYIFKYNRYEPTNPYVFHKCVPSARNIHTNEPYIIFNGDIVRYNCKLDNFEYIKYDESMKNRCEIIMLAELWRVMKFYGEFGMVLPLIDAGHILGQLKIELEKNNYHCSYIQYAASSEEDYYNINASSKSTLITFKVDLSSNFLYKDIEVNIDNNRRINNRRSINYDGEINSYMNVKDFLNITSSFKHRKMICDKNKLRNICTKNIRESAHNTVGICSVTDFIKEKNVKSIFDNIQQYIRHYIIDYYNYNIYIIYKNEEKITKLLSLKNEKIKESILKDINKRELLHDTKTMIIMDSMPMIIYISYNYDKEISERENIYNSHIGAGEINQYLSIFVTNEGLFARPVRNFEDDNVKKLLQIESDNEYLIYSLICGVNNTRNYIISL